MVVEDVEEKLERNENRRNENREVRNISFANSIA